MEVEIACPKCDWQPQAGSRWQCTCGHSWNTFDTGGTCPRCLHRWHDTQCLSCAGWSPHLDWYRNLDQWVAEQLVAELQPVAR
ncbi:hypothetical protein [Hymenobacter edaphi]|uniref:Uncharacterized protein n=1 Tax=Hymenobacter edaphi TaxID=2211146 RepID=A0A328BMX1_9BACT|nr:hypothetical protein [Hymenobacter edaphi]RAK68035.1 hypothetical protein DLM85_08315 [Hymenobacter edaphi]